MPRLAPRYSPLILEWALALDDPTQPIAETVRRVGDAASAFGLTRPSYSHLSRTIRRDRRLREIDARRRREMREAVLGGLVDAASGRLRAADVAIDGILAARERAERALRDLDSK